MSFDKERSDPSENEQPEQPAADGAANSSLSEKQQDRLKVFWDEELQSISRNFLRGISTSDQGYRSMDPLLRDLSKVIDLIWYSIVNSGELFGQTFYLLRIADELVDYISAPNFSLAADLVIQVTQTLDNHFSKLVNGFDQIKLAQTEVIRLESIAERTRLAVVESFEEAHADGYELEIGNVYTKVFDAISY